MPSPSTNRATTSQKKLGAGRAGDGPGDHDQRDDHVHPFAPDQVGETAKEHRPEERRQDRRARHPARLGRRQVPLLGDERRDGADDKQVVGIGEESGTGDDDGPVVEPAAGCLVEQIAHRRGADGPLGEGRIDHRLPSWGMDDIADTQCRWKLTGG